MLSFRLLLSQRLWQVLTRLVAGKLATVFLVTVSCGTVPVLARADVFEDRQLTQDQAFSLTRLLTRAVNPGGTRHIRINANPLTVKRHALPGRDKGTMVLDQIEAGYKTNPGQNRIIPARYDALNSMLVDQSATTRITQEADRLVEEERAVIVAALEQPFRYRAGIWDIYARIPVAALAPNSTLGGLPASDGFIYMAELSPETSQGYWEIRFGENFHLGAILSDHKGDAPGYDPPVARFPGTRRTLTYDERANNWQSSSWSFEGRGQVAKQSAHYVRHYEQLGFVRKAIGASDAREVMVQLARGNEQAVVYVVNTGAGKRPVQVTIQQSRQL